MVQTGFPVVVMKHPEVSLPAIDIDHSVSGNMVLAFVKEGATLQIHSTTPEETKCAGLVLDKQHIYEITSQSQGCGCYSMLSRRSKLVLDHWIHVTKDSIEVVMEHFRLLSFLSYYLTERIPGSVHFSSLQMTTAFLI
eukprot:10237513-Ditylum_brightwellii.AAC.1